MIITRNTGLAAAAFLVTLLISSSSYLVDAQDIDYPSVAYLPKSWTNSPVFDFGYWDLAGVSPILINGTFVCGFHCQNLNGNCLFAISIFQTKTSDGNSSLSPKIVWSANRNNPVKLRATLQLSEKGDLMLQDLDGTLVWNTYTAGKSVSGLKLTEEGNLVLYDRNNKMVWQSFGHPTDTLVPGQALVSGQKLTANMSTSNSGAGLYSLALINDSLIALLEPDDQQVYFGPLRVKTHELGKYLIRYVNGRFGRFVLPSTSAVQFIQLGSDGHLRAYQLRESKWEQVSDLLINYTGACGFPLACGEYGFCSDGHCSCPKAEGDDESVAYFSQVSQLQPNLGCSENRPVSCKPSGHHSHNLLEFKDFDYFYFVPHITNANRKKCKEACLKNCSCRAAIHRQQINSSKGYCFLLPKILSFRRNAENMHYYQSFAYLKVQNPPTAQTTSRAQRRRQIIAIIGSTVGATVFILLVVICIFTLRTNKTESEDEKEMPLNVARSRFTRFSYDYLSAVTQNFSVKLGEGGFGSVFYGSLPCGTKIAVKCLDGTNHIKNSFVAEVETFRSVNHVNLVTLIGFCAENSHRLLVYEYLQNGSLDRWIFNRNPESTLGWKLRQKIIHDVAKGLAYLHNGCNRKILHLDIKPQNILLDENYNACLADFGLSKLIDRDQNQVFTTMRGTPGYMAPEWSSATITDKVDVYSFGIVVMEILCGRRNVDRSQPEEETHLLRLFTRKAEEGKLLELVDKVSEDMQSNGAEVVRMMKVAAWCLQADYTRRPSMPKVLSVLKGDLDVEDNLNYDFLTLKAPPRATATTSYRARTTTQALPSILSGPR